MSLLDTYKEDPFEVISTISLKDLVKLITDANDQYYNYDNPLMTDQEYDLLKEELEKRNPKHKLLTQIAHETHLHLENHQEFQVGTDKPKISNIGGLGNLLKRKISGRFQHDPIAT